MFMPKLGVKNIIANWSAESQEIAQGVIDKYGEPHEATPSMLIWYNNGPWKRTIVYREAVKHNFPIPHMDGVEQFIDHVIPMEKACEIAAFDGSVTIHPTRGELSACCHDEAANLLAINLAHDIIEDRKTFELARSQYVNAMLAFRQKKPVPYMERLHFQIQKDTADPDESTISQQELNKAAVSG